MFTTDANVFGSREWDQRNYRAPGPADAARVHSTCCATRAGWRAWRRDGMPRFRNLEAVPAARCDLRARRQHGHPAAVRCHHQLGRYRLDARAVARQAAHQGSAERRATPSVPPRSGAMASCSATTAAGSSTTAWRRSRCCRRSRARSVRASTLHHRQRLPPRHRRGQGAGARRARGHARPRHALRAGRRRRRRGGPRARHPAPPRSIGCSAQLGCTSVAELTAAAPARRSAPEHGEQPR